MSNRDDSTSDVPIEPEEELDEIIEEEPEEEEEPSEVLFENLKGYVGVDDSDRISQQGFYGTRLDDGRLELEPVEVLHLLERKRILLKISGDDLIDASYVVNALLSEDPDLWVKYLVFRDLRSRGYAIRQGFGGGIGFRVYGRGDKPGSATAKQLIHVLKEGIPISLHDLNQVTETAATARKNLLFALVDQNGEVNYYKVAQAKLRDVGGSSNNE